MTITVEVTPELEIKLETEAKRSGMSKVEFVRTVLEEKLNPPTKRRKPPFEAKIIATDLPVRDLSREYEWLEKNRDEYDGQWVVLAGDKLIAASFDGKEVARKARELAVKDTFLVFVEGNNRPRFISGGVW